MRANSTSRNRAKARLLLEQLEERCVLSPAALDLSAPGLLMSLSQTSSGLAAAEVHLNGGAESGWIVGEADEQLDSAPTVALSPGQETVLLGFIGNSHLLAESSQANDVDVVQLTVGGTGETVVQFDLLANVYGSTLDPTLTVLDASGNVVLQWRDSQGLLNAKGYPVTAYRDVRHSIALAPGTYYVLVSSEGVTLDGAELDTPLSRPDAGGTSTGGYVLSMRATEYTGPVQVESITVSNTDGAGAEPLTVSVTFSDDVDRNTLPGAVWITGEDGTQFELVWTGYDSETHTATYIPLDRLGPGVYEVLVSRNTFRDQGGYPLAADAVASFTVSAGAVNRGEGNGDVGDPVNLPYLYASEAATGIVITGDGDGANDVDVFIQTLPGRARYVLRVDAPETVVVTVQDSAGQPLAELHGGQEWGVVQDAGDITIVVRAPDTVEYAVHLTTEGHLPGVPVEVDLPLPDLSVTIVGPGAALPELPVDSVSDPAVASVVSDPMLQIVLDYVTGRTAESESIAVEGAPAESDATQGPVTSAAPFVPLPPLVANFPTARRGDMTEDLREALVHDGLSLQPENNESAPLPDIGTLEAITYAFRTLWTPTQNFDEEPHVDWGKVVTLIQQPGRMGVAEVNTQITYEGNNDLVRPLQPADIVPTEGLQDAPAVDTTKVAAVALGTGAATTSPVRRTLAALLRKLANWLAS